MSEIKQDLDKFNLLYNGLVRDLDTCIQALIEKYYGYSLQEIIIEGKKCKKDKKQV